MSLSLPTLEKPEYSIPETALRRWVEQRVRSEPRAGGGVRYTFALSGSTCTNRPLEAVMTVILDRDGRITGASSRPAVGDAGCGLTCAANGDGGRFLADVGACEEAIGLTLEHAAFRNWHAEPSGCFCTAGNRRHKWRNVFQTLHYALTHPDLYHRGP